MTHRAGALALLCLTAPLAAQVAPVPSDPSGPVSRDWDAIDRRSDAAALRASIRFLADDLLEGRSPGSRGDALARLYLATRLQGAGFLPAGVEGGWEQPVPIIGVTAKVSSPLSATGKDGTRLGFVAPDDYTCQAGRAEPRSEWRQAGLVFVGYGITAPEQRWDDWKGVDVRGKVVLVMNNDPESDPELFAGKRRLYYGRWSYKYEEAARRGAIGAIVIHTTPSAGYPFQVIQAGQGGEHFALPPAEGVPSLAIQAWCSEDAARKLAQLGGHDLDTLRAQAETRAFAPVDLGVTLDLATENSSREIRSANVIGLLRGSDPKLRDEHVVVTAHFDHLGRGRERNRDDLYNGAVDNASGCGAALELARVLGGLDPAPRRSVLVVFVTGEESGLIGSRWYAQTPTVPIRSIVANFNLDGMNIWGATEDLEMIGHGKSELSALADTVAKRRGRRIEADKQPELGLFYRSDHFSFAQVGVPSAYFKAGGDFLENREGRQRLKASYTTVHYHQPSDQYDPRWLLDGAAADLRLIVECLVRCADADAPPRWTPGDEFEARR